MAKRLESNFTQEQLQLAEGTVDLVNAVKKQGTEVLIFLDKSARPVAHLFRRAWGQIFPRESRPAMRHMNMPKSFRFASSHDTDFEEAVREVRSRFRDMSGKKVTVIDEIMASGATARKASEIIQAAFPRSKVTEPIGVFPVTPSWYGQSDMLGVVENGKEMIVQKALGTRDKFLTHRRELTALIDNVVPHVSHKLHPKSRRRWLFFTSG